MLARWVAAGAPEGTRELVAAGHPLRLAELLAQRGCRDAASAAAFLAPSLDQLHPPRRLRGVAEAVELLDAACDRGAKIAVVGDYDVDGVSATALLVALLRSQGAAPVPILGRRHEEGYGFLPVHVEAAAARGAELLVTVDCGTNSTAAVAAARTRGLPVVVTDHHLPEGEPADGMVLINPRQPGCDYPDRDLTGAGLALKLGVALLEQRGAEIPWEPLLRIACLGTIADVAPLVGENRVIAALGLAALERPRSPGLRALMRSAGVRPPVRASDVGFRLGPRLNAAGRLGAADPALELLLARDEQVAARLAEQLEAANRERQSEEARVVEEARRRLEDDAGDAKLGVAWSPRWNRGVVGIAASRLTRELGRPVVLLAVEGERATGSGRSVPGIHLHDFLRGWSDRLERFGGHAAAIGLTAATGQLETLAAEWRTASAAWPDEALERVRRYDLKLAAEEIDGPLLAQIERLGPFGPGNEAPVFRVGLRVASAPRTFGRGHASARVGVGADGRAVELVAWGGADRRGELTGELDALVRLERDRRGGGVRLNLVEARPAGRDGTLESGA